MTRYDDSTLDHLIWRSLDRRRRDIDGDVTVAEIAEALGAANTPTRAALNRLERQGLVQRTGWSDRNARCWAITENGKTRFIDCPNARAGGTTR